VTPNAAIVLLSLNLGASNNPETAAINAYLFSVANLPRWKRRITVSA